MLYSYAKSIAQTLSRILDKAERDLNAEQVKELRFLLLVWAGQIRWRKRYATA